MQINPLERIDVHLKHEGSDIEACLMSLSDAEIKLSSRGYLPAKGLIDFSAKHFQGQAGINKILFEDGKFIYYLEIYTIHFQPGFLVNCRS